VSFLTTANKVPNRCSFAGVRNLPLVRAYYSLHPSGHWFDDDTLRFFDGRIEEAVITGRKNWLFVSSECPPYNNRRYAVRLMRTDSNSTIAGKHIENVSGFCEYSSRVSAMARMIREIPNC